MKNPEKAPKKKPLSNVLDYAKKNRYVAKWSAWRASRPRWQRKLITVCLVLAGLISVHLAVEASWRPIRHPHYGVSFSTKYAEELGLDWRQTYEAVLSDLGFTRLRLMSYWDLHEKANNNYDFSDLDWQMNKALEKGIKVSLAVGLRQPRWPECHSPQWAKDIGYGTDNWQKELNEYIETVVKRYRDHPALLSYQLENEAVNAWFGECPGTATSKRLVAEFNLIKVLDPRHQVWMSLSDQHGFPVNEPRPDAYGFSVYRTVWNDKLPISFYTTYPTPVWYHKARKFLIEKIKDRPVFVHELQVEPWGPKPTRDLSLEEQDKSMDLNQIRKNFDFARKIGSDEIYTWGAEWWYWRKVKFNDAGPWEAVRTELTK